MWKVITLMVATLAAPAATAAEWVEPERGTATRKALMDAIRPHAEWQLGRPIEFVVHDLRQSGDLAFSMISAQRPGGGEIDIYNTPVYQRGEIEPDIQNGTELQALYRKVGETWVAVHWALGATDVWFAWGPYCREYRPVISDFCRGVE